MFQTYEVEIKGAAPILMHNGRLTDRRNPFTREMARYTKRGANSKSDETTDRVEHIEWCGGLYHTGEVEIADGYVKFAADAKVVMPADNIWSCLVEGATINKLGTVAKAAIIIDDDGIFIHDGPKDLNKLAAEPEFTSRKRAKIGMSAVMRTRPIFRKWSCTFRVSVDTEQLDVDQLREAIVNAGLRKGLCDWTPRFGRFQLVAMREV